MTPVVAGILFLVIFAVILVAVSLGSKFLEIRGKKQMETMLNPEIEESEESGTTSILVDPRRKDIFDTLLNRSDFPAKIQAFLQQAGLPWAPSKLVMLVTAGVVIGAVFGWVIRPLDFALMGLLFFATVFGLIPIFYVSYKRNSRLQELESQLPEALDFLARSMRAGHAFSISLEMLGTESPDPIGQEFRALFAETNFGAPLETALANFGIRVPLLDVRLFVSSVLVQRQTGGNLSEILSRLAYLIRERFRLRGQVKAASAHGRMTSIVLTMLPIVMVFALTWVAPGYLPQMVADPDGKWMIVGAVLAQIAGYLVMRKITNIKV